ncbi:MAG: hypothetical protein QOI22_972 [Verrucomicrobiota bacterium]
MKAKGSPTSLEITCSRGVGVLSQRLALSRVILNEVKDLSRAGEITPFVFACHKLRWWGPSLRSGGQSEQTGWWASVAGPDMTGEARLIRVQCVIIILEFLPDIPATRRWLWGSGRPRDIANKQVVREP